MPKLRLAMVMAPLLAACATMSATPPTGGLALETVGNRADLISGGDVLVRAIVPATANASAGTMRRERRMPPSLPDETAGPGAVRDARARSSGLATGR